MNPSDSTYNPLPVSGQTPAQPQGNWLEKLLPTIGGIGGGVLGALIPGLGETGISEVGGASAGSALGQKFENMLTGSKGSTLGAGVLGGVGTLGGMGLGRVIGQVAKDAVPATEQAAGIAAKPATGIVGMMSRRGAAAQGATDQLGETQNLVNEFGGAMPSGNEQATRAFGDVLDHARQLGIDTTKPGVPQAMLDHSNQGLALYGGAKRAILTNAGPVDMSQMDQVLKDAVEKNVGAIGANGKNISAGQPVYEQLRGNFQSGVVGSKAGSAASGDITGETAVDPQTAFQYVSSLGKQVGQDQAKLSAQTRSLASGGVPDPGLEKQLQLSQDLYNGAKNILYKRPEVTQAISDFKAAAPGGVITPDIISATAKAGPADTGIPIGDINPNSPLAKQVADNLNNATSGQDILTEEAKLIRMNSIAKDAVNHNTQALATPAALQQAKAAAGQATNTGSNLVNTAGAVVNPHAGLVKGALNVVTGKNPAVDRVGAGLLGLLTKSVGPNNSGSLIKVLSQAAALSPTVANAGGTTMQNQPNGQSTDAMPGGPQLATGQPANVGNLISQLDAMLQADPLLASSLAPVIQGLIAPQQKINVAQGALQNYDRTLQQAGGGQGTLLGGLSQLGGMLTGGPQAQVGPQATALRQALDAAGYSNAYIPTQTATAGAAAGGMSNLQSILGQLQGQ
jgi:hypothetical protein